MPPRRTERRITSSPLTCACYSTQGPCTALLVAAGHTLVCRLVCQTFLTSRYTALSRLARVRARDNLKSTNLHPCRPHSVHGLCIFGAPVQAGYAGPPASHQCNHAGLAGHLAGTACKCGVRPCIAATPSPAHQAGKSRWRQHQCSSELQPCCSGLQLGRPCQSGVWNPCWLYLMPPLHLEWELCDVWGVIRRMRVTGSAATGCCALRRGTLLQSRT